MKSKWAIAAAAIITIAVIVTVALMMNRDSQPAEYRIEDGQLAISCSFGISIPVEDIQGLTLTEVAPDVETKTNGAGIGSMHKGEYRLTDGSAARLYIDTNVPLFIRFTQGDTVFFLNAENPEATQALYNEITAAMG